MYWRRLGGMLERAVLGAAMTIVLAILERRLSRPRNRRSLSLGHMKGRRLRRGG